MADQQPWTVKLRRSRRRAIRFLGRSFLPPKPFEPPALEQRFHLDYARRFAAHRRGAAILALLTWITYFGWDYFHATYNTKFADYLFWMMTLRALGTLAIAASIAALSIKRLRDNRSATLILGFAGTSAYAILVVMMFILPFPYNYMFYFIGLLEVLLFIFGLLRLLSRAVIKAQALCLAMGVIALPLSARRTDQLNSDMLESYYSAAAITYLVSFVIVGVVVAIELERTARTTFLRERRLRDVGAAFERANVQLIAAQGEAEARTRALIAAKDEMQTQAEQQSRDKSRFLASAAHDLRQPMQALSNLLEAGAHAFERGDVEQGRELLGMGRQAAQLTRSTFNAVLDISRLESGFVEAEPSNFGCGELLGEVAAGLRAQANEDGVRLRLRRTGTNVVVRSDRHILARVVANLVANAIKYSDPAKPDRAVVIGVIALPTRARIDIVDNGVGIDPKRWEDIFRPFVQLGNEERDRDKGIGLGLSIVKSSIDLLPGHRLDMRSHPGRGTRFSVELPLAPAGSAALESAAQGEAAAFGDWRGAYVLYVEDDAVVRRSTERLLEAYEIRYEAFGSLAELKSGIARFEMTPDLILSDYRLPDERTADDVVIFAEGWFEDALPVVVVTGEVSLAAREGWEVLHKPVATDRLLAAIARAKVSGRAAAE